MTPAELLSHLPRTVFETYAELENALTTIMLEYQTQVSFRVSPGDVLQYAALHGLVARTDEGLKIVQHV